MPVSENLRSLITAAEPLWAGESEIVRSYWDSPVRTEETDRLWIRRQCSKEFNGSGVGEYKNLGVFLGPLTELQEVFPKIDAGVNRHYALDLIEMLHDEFEHYVLLADIYDATLAAGDPPIQAHALETWDEDVALTALRHKHIAEQGELGKRACRLTEGGYCALFREGMALKGRGGIDDMIAAACTRIYEDEFGHMLAGIIGLDQEGLGGGEWELMTEMMTDQMHHRIQMRNAQFSFPVAENRIQEIFDGQVEPMKFDYGRAETLLAV